MEGPLEDIRMAPLQAWQRFRTAVVDICRPTWGPGPGPGSFEFRTPSTPASPPTLPVSPNMTHLTHLGVDSEMVEVPDVRPIKRQSAVTVEEVVDEDVLAAEQHRPGFRARSRIPWGTIILAEELFDDFPESHADELQKQAKEAEVPEVPAQSADALTAAASPTGKSQYQPPPSMREAQRAHTDIKKLVKDETRKKSSGKLLSALQEMKMLLNGYTGGTYGWIAASLHVTEQHESGIYRARQLRSWTRSFISDRNALPHSNMGTWNLSLLDKHPNLKAELNTHLQGIGKYIRAQDIVDFTEDPMVQLRYGFHEAIKLSTAQLWMDKLDYRWAKAPRGQYVDGHERHDVVAYRDTVFLPTMEKLEPRIALWSKEGRDVPILDYELRPIEQPYVLWYHDESVFYAHDRRTTRWVHKDEPAVPLPKGEGPSLMVSDFVSAEYGWLCSPDGQETARVLMKPGKNRNGYFDNTDILKQVEEAMDILQRHYPHQQHIFIYDNATTHLKRSADALSARSMSLKPTSEGSPSFFGVTVTVTDDITGKPVYGPDGKVLKKKVKMGNFPTENHSLYTFPMTIPAPAYSKAWQSFSKSVVSAQLGCVLSAAKTSTASRLRWHVVLGEPSTTSPTSAT